MHITFLLGTDFVRHGLGSQWECVFILLWAKISFSGYHSYMGSKEMLLVSILPFTPLSICQEHDINKRNEEKLGTKKLRYKQILENVSITYGNSGVLNLNSSSYLQLRCLGFYFSVSCAEFPFYGETVNHSFFLSVWQEDIYFFPICCFLSRRGTCNSMWLTPPTQP